MADFKLVLSNQFKNHPRTRKVLKRLVLKEQSALTDASHDKPVSIVIRCRNEAKTLDDLLEAIKQQVYTASLELIVVDNDSDDGSVEVARRHGAKVIHLPKDEFTYPRSMNLGAAAAKHPLILLLVGHVLPAHNYWLRSGIRHFTNPEVAGVYGCPVSDDTSKKLDSFFRYMELRFYKPRVSTILRTRTSVLGAHCCIVRADLWKQHHFDEAYAAGGEDTAWAGWALDQGYTIIRDPIFSVHHSHAQTAWGLIKQTYNYTQMLKPRPISSMSEERKQHYQR